MPDSTDHTATARQRAWRKKMRDEGRHNVTLWVTAAQREELRRQYPGPNNGIDWPTVLDAALKKKVDGE